MGTYVRAYLSNQCIIHKKDCVQLSSLLINRLINSNRLC